jgi:hypothetical protein
MILKTAVDRAYPEECSMDIDFCVFGHAHLESESAPNCGF